MARLNEVVAAFLRKEAGFDELRSAHERESLLDSIMSKESASWIRADKAIAILDPTTGEPKEVLRRLMATYGQGDRFARVLRRAAEAPKQNQIEWGDLDWFVPAAVVIAEQIEIQSWSGEEADYGRLVVLLNDESVRWNAVFRLQEGGFFVNLQKGDSQKRANKLALILDGKLEQASQPLSAKLVSWVVVRNIANSLTNQLPREEVDLSQAHMSNFGQGPAREFTLEPGREGDWRPSGSDGEGWHAFDEEDVSRLFWQSLSSGNCLEAIKTAPGQWELSYVPSYEDPTYRGNYFGMYEHPEEVKNLKLRSREDHLREEAVITASIEET